MAWYWITGVRVAEEGTNQEHISHYEVTIPNDENLVWKTSGTKTAVFPKSEVVGWAQGGSEFWVSHGGKTVQAALKKRYLKSASALPQVALGSPSPLHAALGLLGGKVSYWLQTVADDYYDDNLMSLKRV